MQRPSKLSFKGAKKALPREYVKPLVGNSIDGHQPDKKASEATERSPLVWVNAERHCDLQGPLMLLHKGAAGLATFRFNENGTCEKCLLSKDPAAVLAEFMPELDHIILGQWIGDIPLASPQHGKQSSTQPGVFGLKTWYGKYVSVSSKSPVIDFEREAIGPTEEWIPEFVLVTNDDCHVAFKSKFNGKYLAFTGVKFHTTDEKDDGLFIVRVQYEKRQAQRAKYEKKDVVGPHINATENLASYELEQARKYQSYGTKQFEEESLKRAAQTGSVHEALLDRRVKSKSDKFCK